MSLFPYWMVVNVHKVGYPSLPGVVVNFSQLGLTSDDVHSGTDTDDGDGENGQIVYVLPLGRLVSVNDLQLEPFDADRVRRNLKYHRRRRKARGISRQKMEESIRRAQVYVDGKLKDSEMAEDIKRLMTGKDEDVSSSSSVLPTA